MEEIRFERLVGRERILRAALHRFAADGYARASLCSIASQAQVSEALILRHFGSKQELRDTVDAGIRALFTQAALAAHGSPERRAGATVLDAFAASIRRAMRSRPVVHRYLWRTIAVDEAPNGTRLLQWLLTLARDLLEEAWPGTPRWEDQALRLLLLALGPTLLGPTLWRCTPEAFERTAQTASAGRQRDGIRTMLPPEWSDEGDA